MEVYKNFDELPRKYYKNLKKKIDVLNIEILKKVAFYEKIQCKFWDSSRL